MSYWITKFRDVTLPTRRARQEVGVGAAYGTVRTLSGGGGFDPQGTRPARRTPWRLSVEGVVTSTTDAGLVTACEAVRGLLGLAGTLYRTPDGGTANSQWTWARCVNITAGRQPPDRYHWPVQMTFEVQSPSWYATSWQSTATPVSSGSNTNAAIPNAGNAPVYNPVLRVKSTGAMTAFSVRSTDTGYETHVTYTGSVPSGGTLVIDCAQMTVTCNGTPVFGGFTYGASAERQEWLILAPGTANLIYSPTGAGGTATIERYAAYA